MSEVKHTPGPWDVHADKTPGIWRTHGVYVCGTAGWPEGQLARVNTQDGLDEQVANARLIAAAPDMLAALQAFEMARLTDTPKDWRRATDLTDAAITKAVSP